MPSGLLGPIAPVRLIHRFAEIREDVRNLDGGNRALEMRF